MKTRTHRKIKRKPSDRKRIETARKKFQAERPTLAKLIESGEYVAVPHGEYLTLLEVMQGLKQERQRQGLSLSKVAERSGIDKASLSRLENGQTPNPTIETVWKYASAVGKEIVWTLTDSPAKESVKPTK